MLLLLERAQVHRYGERWAKAVDDCSAALLKVAESETGERRRETLRAAERDFETYLRMFSDDSEAPAVRERLEACRRMLRAQ